MSEQIFRATALGDSDRIATHDGLMCPRHPKLRIFRWRDRQLCEEEFTNLRPVRIVEAGQIVIDLTAKERDHFVRWFSLFTPLTQAEQIARKIAYQIKAQTKPEHRYQPEWGSAVMASGFGGPREAWLRHGKDTTFQVWRNREGAAACWSDLIDPVLIRDGI